MKRNLNAQNLRLMYGTAWKEDRTESLVTMALKAGFRAIDTANQRKHYMEAGVGAALAEALKGPVKREEIFLQTKFTSLNGQDHRLPYDPSEDPQTQVQQSFDSSLTHLQVDYIDSYILHGPSHRKGLSEYDWQVWKAMEGLVEKEKTTYIGVSNMSLEQLQLLVESATIKPTFIQNRCYAQLGWDKAIRDYCKAHQIIYQGFSLLTANPFALAQLTNLSQTLKKTPSQIVFRFAQQQRMLPLTGTSSLDHMKEDLALDFELSEDELNEIEQLAN